MEITRNKKPETIGITPGVAILSMLKHLNYKPYYALAEFVDNAIDSFQKNETILKEMHGADFKLEVSIELDRDKNKITIRDNAAGIDAKNYKRAFRPADIPPDNTRLSEFGMGMKSASCWFANQWNVRSTAIGEEVEKMVNFDIVKIVNDTTEELEVIKKICNKDKHYTVVTLFDVNKKMPFGRGFSKVKKHLASIYRDFLREDFLVLKLNSEKLSYKTPKILHAKRYDQVDDENAKILEWKKEIIFDFGDFKVQGFVAIMDKAARSDSGFALFRRGRVIEGSADTNEGFRPEEIFKQLGGFTYIRLFGELHLEGFEVSHTKDGFQWDDNLEVFLDLLKEELNHDKLPILKQADKYRARESKRTLEKAAKDVIDNTIKAINTDELSSNINNITTESKQIATTLQEVQKSYSRNFLLEFNGVNWHVCIELSYDESIGDLVEIGEHLSLFEESENRNDIGIRLSLLHPFMVNFIGADKNKLEPFMRFVVALCLSEISMKQLSPEKYISEVRENMNDLLKGALSKNI